MTVEELQELLRARFGDHVEASAVAWGQVTVTLDAEGYVAAARFCRDDPRLDCDFFDCLFGVDEREQGFAVIAILYSTVSRQRVLLRHVCAGGRERPAAPTLTHLYRGADWHEREAWDMFGIEFDGHPGLAPRLLTTENFEGWPLRKDFPLATREAKPWPGAKEPAEAGTEAEREEALTSTVTSAGITGDQQEGARETAAAKAERARRKAAELRRQRATERAASDQRSSTGAAGEEPAEGPARAASDERSSTGAAGEEPAEGPASAGTEADRQASVASDPRVSRPEDRAGGGQDLGGARSRTAETTSRGPHSEEASEGDDEPSQAGPEAALSGSSQGEEPTAAGSGSEAETGEETDAARAARAVRESRRAHERDIGVYDQTAVPGEHTAGAGDAGVLGGAYLGGPPAPPAGPGAPHEQGTTPTEAEQQRLGRATTKQAGEVVVQPAEEARPGAKAGEPPVTQTPGLAPVEGGIHEHIDRQAEATAGPSGGDRPASTRPPAVMAPPPVPAEAPTVLELGGASPRAEGSLGPSGPRPAGEVGGPPPDASSEVRTERVPVAPTDRATAALPDRAFDTLRGEQPGPRPSDADLDQRMPPAERAHRDPATPGGDDPTAASGIPEAESRHGPADEHEDRDD